VSRFARLVALLRMHRSDTGPAAHDGPAWDATVPRPPTSPARRRSAASTSCLLALALLAGCRREVLFTPLDAGPSDAQPDAAVGDVPAPDAPPAPLELLRVLPGHGPFSGGNALVLRGAGFTSSAIEVRLGALVVPPSDVRRIDPNRLEVIAPPQDPGPVDVVIDDGTFRALLPAGYVYDPVSIAPSAGPPGGGITLTLRAASDTFDAATVVELDGLPCTEWSAASAREGSCRTPAHDLGVVDVTVRNGAETLVLEDAFTYESPIRPWGGLGGGPLDGEITVLVHDQNAAPLEGALVVVGRGGAFPYHATTGPTGTVTFRGDDIRARMDVFASHPCYHHAGFVGVDAAFVTAGMRLAYISCVGGGGTGGPGPGAPTGSSAGGELVFYGGEEFAEPTFDWVGVPEPAAGEERVAYVALASTRDFAGSGSSAAVIATARVTEADRGARGFRFAIDVPATLVIPYAVAGIEADGTFVPHVVGLGTPIVLAPGRRTDGVEIRMDAPLVPGRRIRVEPPALPVVFTTDFSDTLTAAPVDTLTLLVRYAVPGLAAGLPLFGPLSGPRGMPSSVPDDFTVPLGTAVEVALQPSAVGRFGEAEHEFVAVLAPSSSGAVWSMRPHTRASLRTPLRTERVVIPADAFLEIPRFTAPAVSSGGGRDCCRGPLPSDRTVRWEQGSGHTLYRLFARRLFGEDYGPAWFIVAHPSARAITFPDLRAISPDVEPLPAGAVRFVVEAVDIPALDFDRIDLRLIDALPVRRSAMNQLDVEVP